MAVERIESGPPKTDGDKRREAEQAQRKALLGGQKLMAPLVPAGVSYRVCFVCGCVYERVFLGAFEKPGYKLTPCRDHTEHDEELKAAGVSTWERLTSG